MSYLGAFRGGPGGSAENTLTAPNGKRKTAKAVFSWVFLGVKEPAFAGSGPNLRVGPPESRGACFARSAGRFLDEKRGFLTAFVETLSVLFGRRIRVLEDPDPSCSGTPFWPAPARKCLVFPILSAKAGQKSGQKVTKTGLF